MKKRLHLKQIRLTRRESIRLVDLMENPPPRNQRFLAAKARYDELSRQHGSSHVTPIGGNIFLDLGFPPDVAALLQARTDSMILSNSIASDHRCIPPGAMRRKRSADRSLLRSAIRRMQEAPPFFTQEAWDVLATYDGPVVSGDPEGRIPENLEEDDYK